MELILQQGLPHQQKAVDNICEVLKGVYVKPSSQVYDNPEIFLGDPAIIENIKTIQQSIPAEYRSKQPIGDCLNIDIKMETGTGKTYVYTKTMYELNKRYGFNKFIIVVPSLAIKAGTSQFLKDNYVKHHFTDECGYGTEIEVGVLEPPKNKKVNRLYFPNVVSDFVKGSIQNSKKIYVLLVNMQLLTNNRKKNGRDKGLLWRDDYDYGVKGFYRPFDAISYTKPVVIIDEPHRFSEEKKAYSTIVEQIRPQCIIRFGATFPDITSGKGKNKQHNVKDYKNLIYDLNACEAFNQGLIKGVAKEHFSESISMKEEKVKITSINRNEDIHVQYIRKDKAIKNYTLKKGNSLAEINDAFSGITITSIDKNAVTFSNGVVKNSGEELNVDIYMTSYQEEMLKLALQRHFETEKKNFCSRKYKIKTLALFFIDDISSYREKENGKKTYLLTAFESILKETIEKVINELEDHETEYRKYLEASLSDISACHAGYFSEDNNESKEEIAKELDDILHNKKGLLSFKNEDGSYNTRRFLFSKWTLKEGWDNPNVFTIAKLRSSGSDISRLQEVGRGLRLPVDENGNRVSNEEFMLNYIVDFTEANFAHELVDQINGEIPEIGVITEEKLVKVAEKLGKTADDLFDELYSKRYIDRHYNIKSEMRDAFFTEYPDFSMGLVKGNVIDRNEKTKPEPIKIRKEAFKDIKELWEKINQRYVLVYDSDLDDNMEDVVLSIFEKQGVFANAVMISNREIITGVGKKMEVVQETGVQYTVTRTISYGDFLKRISFATSIPITIIHSALCKYAGIHGRDFEKCINDNSVAAFCAEFQNWKNDNLQGHYCYEKSNSPIGATALTYEDGTPRSEIDQWRIGTKRDQGTPASKYLYDAYAYDSPLEKNNIMTDNSKIVAYGKIPRKSIAIPTVTGESYSPDFMYVVKKGPEENEINIIVETKDLANKANLRGVEKAKIECAKVFFNMLKEDGYTVYFRDQIGTIQMIQIIEEICKM